MASTHLTCVRCSEGRLQKQQFDGCGVSNASWRFRLHAT